MSAIAHLHLVAGAACSPSRGSLPHGLGALRRRAWAASARCCAADSVGRGRCVRCFLGGSLSLHSFGACIAGMRPWPSSADILRVGGRLDHGATRSRGLCRCRVGLRGRRGGIRCGRRIRGRRPNAEAIGRFSLVDPSLDRRKHDPGMSRPRHRQPSRPRPPPSADRQSRPPPRSWPHRLSPSAPPPPHAGPGHSPGSCRRQRRMPPWRRRTAVLASSYAPKATRAASSLAAVTRPHRQLLDFASATAPAAAVTALLA